MDEILTIHSDTSDSDLEIVNAKVYKPTHDSQEVLLSHKQKQNIVTLLRDSKIHLPVGSVIRARQTCVPSSNKNINPNIFKRCSVSINGRHLTYANTKCISNKAVKEIEILSVSSSDESDTEDNDLSVRRVHLLGSTRKVLDPRRGKVTNKKSVDVDLSPIRFSKRSRYSLLPQKTVNVNTGRTLAKNKTASTPVRSLPENEHNKNQSDLDIQSPPALSPLEQTNVSLVPIGIRDSTVSTPKSNTINTEEDPDGLDLIPFVNFSPISLSPSSNPSPHSQDPISYQQSSVRNKSLLPLTISSHNNDLVIMSSLLLDQINNSQPAHSTNPTVCTPESNFMLTEDNLDLALPSSSYRKTSTARTMLSPMSNPVPSGDYTGLAFSPMSLTSSSNHSSQSLTNVPRTLSSGHVKNYSLKVHQDSTPPPSKTPRSSPQRKLTEENISLINNFNKSVSLLDVEHFSSNKVKVVSTPSIPKLISSSSKISIQQSFLPPHTWSTSTQTACVNDSPVVIAPISTSSRPNISNEIEEHLSNTDDLNQSIDPFFTYGWTTTWSKEGKLFISVEEVQIMLNNSVIPEKLIYNFDIRQEVLMECWTISHLSLSLVIKLLKEFGGKTNLLETVFYTLEIKEELEILVASTDLNHNEVDGSDYLNNKDTMMAALGLCKIDMVPLLVEQQDKRREELRGKKSLRTGGKKKSKATSRVKKGRKKK